jgi:hypothetical protein
VTRRIIFIATALALAAVLPAVSAQAQSPRTFVSAAGSDSNPCSFAAPCRHFQAAVNATSAGGEVDALDPAGYGPIIISQAVTIEGQGWSYIAPPANGNGILINAVSGKVTIRGVSLNGVGMANAIGILFNSGTSLNVQNSVIENFSRYGILFQPNGSSKISVSNTVVSDNNFGIYIGPTGSGTTNGALDHVHTDDNTNDGITVIRGGSQIVSVVVSDSVSANNGGNGVIATAVNLVTVRNSTITGNGGIGLEAAGGATMVVTRSTISGNGFFGWAADVNSELGTYADNSNDFNGNGGQIVLQYK